MDRTHPLFRDVSRETLEALEHYAASLLKWNRKINLVAKSSVEGIWGRHIADSLQVLKYCPADSTRWIDLGSGAGLPGLIVAIARKGHPEFHVTMIESDERKSVFISSVIADLSLNADVIVERIENVPPLAADVVSARALASVSGLLTFAERHLSPTGICLFLKGRTADNELTDARLHWHMDVEKMQSQTDPDGCILRIGQISRA